MNLLERQVATRQKTEFVNQESRDATVPTVNDQLSTAHFPPGPINRRAMLWTLFGSCMAGASAVPAQQPEASVESLFLPDHIDRAVQRGVDFPCRCYCGRPKQRQREQS